MVGRLATWLRILGFDTISANSFKGFTNSEEDTCMLKLAEIDDRILITRDTELYGRAKNRGLKSLMVMQGNVIDQLKQVRDVFGIKINAYTAVLRCSECNEELQVANVDEVRRSKEMQKLKESGVRIEEFLKRYDEYYKCNDCSKIYWKGGHWKNILRGIEQLTETQKKDTPKVRFDTK
jgi:uncharacterized protein with PIN domain